MLACFQTRPLSRIDHNYKGFQILVQAYMHVCFLKRIIYSYNLFNSKIKNARILIWLYIYIYNHLKLKIHSLLKVTWNTFFYGYLIYGIAGALNYYIF